MELIVINENKLKIILNEREMNEYGLNENEFHLSLTDTRRVLAKILHSSPIKTGFEGTEPNEKLLLQLYPEKNGGCELYITRLLLDENFIKGEQTPMAAEEKYPLLQSPKPTPTRKKGNLCYSFAKIDDLICACRALKDIDSKGESSLYYGNNERYYLFITSREHSADEKSSPECVLSEFGELESADKALIFLNERGKRLCSKSAILRMSKL